jgi:methyltransferase (TIGR00027 family)
MSSRDDTINHVSDTALWVAYYRAVETDRADALFRDPLAKILVGDKGKKIANHMKASAKYTSWSLPIRTWVIDQYVQRLIASEDIQMVLNLGAGLDTRPYRMAFPANLLWVEVDYPHMIEHKERLIGEKPHCRLERVRLDLADRESRKKLFSDLADRSKKILVLTEGVIPYLTESQVRDLADDLHAHDSFRFWIAEYIAPETYRFLRSAKRMRLMKNAPFRFFPENWFGFFKKHGWDSSEVKYLAEESLKLHRKVPGPWWGFLLLPFVGKEWVKRHHRFMGYVLFHRN